MLVYVLVFKSQSTLTVLISGFRGSRAVLGIQIDIKVNVSIKIFTYLAYFLFDFKLLSSESYSLKRGLVGAYRTPV